MKIIRLGSAAQSAYAEVLETVRMEEMSRSVENLSGSFSKKTVKGSVYWYYQYSEIGSPKLRQVFVGPDTDQVRALVAKSKSKITGATPRLAKAAIALGCAATTPVHFRILRRMNEIGFFRAGGILVGTHAFLTYGNLLGVAWGEISRTQDVDFAHAGKRVELALPGSLELQVRTVIESLESGFLPVPAIRPGQKTSTFINNADRQLKIDFLTPMQGGRDAVYEHGQLGIPLQPLPFMEFILEDVTQAAVLSPVGACLVSVPDPARFALHKLLVYAERRTSFPQKARKDLSQAASLLRAMEDDQAMRLRELWADILERGPGWRRRASSALTALRKLAPQLTVLNAMS